jgi:hypothetical protein
MQDYYQKYLKYKTKYTDLKGGYVRNLSGGNGEVASSDSIDNTIAVVELFNKAFNSYIVYRFRFQNAKAIITDFEGGRLVDLSNLVVDKKNNPQVKGTFDRFYKKDLKSVTDNNSILFTLRQDTTKVIKNMLLLDKDAKNQISELKTLLQSKQQNITNPADFIELIAKCELIEKLADPVNRAEYSPAVNPQGLDILRDKTNQIIQLIANAKNNGRLELACGDNDTLDRLFRECFSEIYKLLK